MAVYGYSVLYNGVIYPSGMNVPDEEAEKTVAKTDTPNTEETAPKRKGRPKKEQ